MASLYAHLPDDLQEEVGRHMQAVLAKTPFALLPRVREIAQLFRSGKSRVDEWVEAALPRVACEVVSSACLPVGRIVRLYRAELWVHRRLQAHPLIHYNREQHWYVLPGIHDSKRAVGGVCSIVGHMLIEAAPSLRLRHYREQLMMGGFCDGLIAHESHVTRLSPSAPLPTRSMMSGDLPVG